MSTMRNMLPLLLVLSATLAVLQACERTGSSPPPPAAEAETEAAPNDTSPETVPFETPQSRVESIAESFEDAGVRVDIGEVRSPFHALVTTSNGEDHWRSAGVFVDPLTLAVSYEVIDEAIEITIDLGNCEDVEVLGVVGVDPSHRIALIGLATPPVGVAPLPIGQPPAPGDRLGHRFVFTKLRLPCGFASGSHPDRITVLDVRDLEGFGLTPVIDVEHGFAGECSPIVNAGGELVALLAEKAAGASSLTFPAVMLAEIDRHAPIAPAAYAARERNPAETAILLRHRGERLRVAGDHRDALALLQESARLAPDDWNVLYELGVCLDMTGQPGPALEALARSIEIEPEFAEAQYSLGIVHLSAGHPAAAIAPLQRAVALDPNYANTAAMLSAAFHGTGRLEEALAAGERAIVLEGNEPGHFANLRMMYGATDRHTDAARVARLWTQTYPSDPSGWQTLGESLLALDKYAGAADAFRQAIDLGSTDSRTYQMLIVSLGQAGQLDRARGAVDEALERHPGDKVLLQLRAFIERDG